MRQGRSTWQRSWTITTHTDGSLRPSRVNEVSGLSGKAVFECVESSFAFQSMLATKNIGSSTLVAKDGNPNVGQRGRRMDETKKRCSSGYCSTKRSASILQFYVGRQLLDHVPLQETLGADAERPHSLKMRLRWIWSPNLQACGGRAHTLLEKEDMILVYIKTLLQIHS